MLIQLKCPAQARRPNGEFVTLPKDTYVNYSSKVEGEHMVHRFTAQVYGDQIGCTVEHVQVSPRGEDPEWL